jgi:hypothetical protein
MEREVVGGVGACVRVCMSSFKNQSTVQVVGDSNPNRIETCVAYMYLEKEPVSLATGWGHFKPFRRCVCVRGEKGEREGEESSAGHIQGWGELSTSVFLLRIGACRESERRESEGGPRGGAGGSNQISVVSKIHPLCEVTKTNRSRGDGSLLETPTAHVVTT